MKTKATMLAIMALLLCVPAKSADLYVNNSGQSGTYTTIQAAINAASTGDNIYVSPLNSYQESLSITKSIRIASSVSGSRIIVSQNIKIYPLANIIVELIGIEGKNVILDSQTSTLGPNSRGKTIITDCSFHDINLDVDYLTSVVVKCDLSGSFTARHGKVLGCVVSESINFHDEPNVGIGDTILVKANYVAGEIKIESNDHSMLVENNVANRIRIGGATLSTLLSYWIVNNTINATGNSSYTSSAYWNLQSGLININTGATDLSNVYVINNKGVIPSLYGRTSSQDRSFYSLVGVSKTSASTGGQVTTRPNIDYNFWAYAETGSGFTFISTNGYNSSSTSSSIRYMSFYSEIYFQNQTFGGTYGKAYYYHKDEVGINNLQWDLSNTSNPVIADPHDLESFSSTLEDIGSPSPKFFDTDLTRSDIGHLGGDNSWEMFHGTNSVSGAAYIIGLDLPSEIWPGQTVNLKAEAVHTN